MKEFYKNRLPHIAPIGAIFFVTFRLADSLPRQVVLELKEEMNVIIRWLMKEKPEGFEEQIEKEKKRFFNKYDHKLDHLALGKCYLKNTLIANIVKTKLHVLDGDKYDLIAYCVMSNHVHVLFDTCRQLIGKEDSLNDIPTNYTQLYQIMKLIKGSTAHAANKQLQRRGTFWQKDSYDHYIRNDTELANVINYILQNPVKAGIVENWEDYPHSYIRSRE